ncbi:hypothetical protein [Marivita geojedonensis]|uniref:Uncharacterized protein n=1 Tax=Marivita geojedonensis TaxID=1123756 RepID=A0A1X4NIP5_9RHOB|nr:hypothetical protein [Marivita geojedonensis]OSQ48939.1 hypothetical protein MGEO_13990 [Marivita geojedonensis]PRY75379.1 hypothetical protein CLV76_11569 [Marivita geojedonensis]
MLAKSLIRFVLVCASVMVMTIPARAETPVGSNIDSRVLMGLKANSEGVQALMPKGWTSVPFPGGPMKGSNLLFALIDGILELDPEGAPLDPASRRAVVLVGLGKKEDAVRMYVLRILSSAPERNPYGVATAADIERTQTLSGPANGGRSVSDAWRITSPDGGMIEVDLSYTSGKRSWSPGELFPYSAANPDFSRIYRYNQMVDLVVSTALGKPASGDIRLSNSIPELMPVLDGTEEIIAVMDVPVYVREVSLP